MGQSRIAASLVPGLGIIKDWLGTWHDPELLAASGSWKSLASYKEFTLSCKSWVWLMSWLTVSGSLCWCRDDSSNLACRARSVSSQRRLRNSSIIWQSCVRFSRMSLFPVSKSPHNLILSWSIVGPQIRLMKRKSLRFKFLMSLINGCFWTSLFPFRNLHISFGLR